MNSLPERAQTKCSLFTPDTIIRFGNIVPENEVLLQVSKGATPTHTTAYVRRQASPLRRLENLLQGIDETRVGLVRVIASAQCKLNEEVLLTGCMKKTRGIIRTEESRTPVSS
jgi:hypothetical protein